MNAEEARKLSQSSGGLSEVDTVLQSVTKHAEMGRDNFLAWNITQATVKELRKMKYIVEPGTEYGEQNCFYVRW